MSDHAPSEPAPPAQEPSAAEHVEQVSGLFGEVKETGSTGATDDPYRWVGSRRRRGRARPVEDRSRAVDG